MSVNEYRVRFNESFGEVVPILKKETDFFWATGERGTRKRKVAFRNIKRSIQNNKKKSAFAVAFCTAALGYSVAEHGVVYSAIQAFGVIPFALAYRATQFKEHRHILATSAVSILPLMVQQAALSLYSQDFASYFPGFMMLSHATLAIGAMCTIPEYKTKLRNVAMVGTGVVGAGLAASTTLDSGHYLGFLAVATTLGNSVNFAMKDQHTARARVGYLLLNTANFTYWATQPAVSLVKLFSEVSYFVGHIKAGLKNDIPHADKKDGHLLSLSEKFEKYTFDILWKGKHTDDVALSREEFKKQKNFSGPQ